MNRRFALALLVGWSLCCRLCAEGEPPEWLSESTWLQSPPEALTAARECGAPLIVFVYARGREGRLGEDMGDLGEVHHSE